jgi:hypothetical protein
MQRARAVDRRAQFRLWIFSYTTPPRSSKKWVSRVMMARESRATRSRPRPHGA